jgi:hypothetical protein
MSNQAIMSNRAIATMKPQRNGLVMIGVTFALLTFLTSGIAAAVVVNELKAPASVDVTVAHYGDYSSRVR